MLQPCPLLDNPRQLREMVSQAGARSTEAKDPEDVAALCAKCEQASEKWAVTAERLWKEEPRGKNRGRHFFKKEARAETDKAPVA